MEIQFKKPEQTAKGQKTMRNEFKLFQEIKN